MAAKLVFCLEGVHATGKSSLISFLRTLEYHTTLLENFELIGNLEPTKLITECSWILGWFKRMAESLDTWNCIIIDRSPYSALMYCDPSIKSYLTKLIEDCFSELHAKYKFDMHVIMVCVPDDVIFERIKHRLESEPHRKQFDEDKIQHTVDIIKNYKHRFCEVCTIDTVVHNIDLYNCADQIIMYVRKKINSQ